MQFEVMIVLLQGHHGWIHLKTSLPCPSCVVSFGLFCLGCTRGGLLKTGDLYRRILNSSLDIQKKKKNMSGRGYVEKSYCTMEKI